MARKKDDPGFQPSAGLVRSFEVDESKNIRINPLVAILIPFALLVVLVVTLVILLG